MVCLRLTLAMEGEQQEVLWEMWEVCQSGASSSRRACLRLNSL